MSTGEPPRLRAPRRGLRPWIAGLALRLGGWTPAGDPPDVAKLIIVAAPHTALADGFWMVALAWWWGLDVHWLVARRWAPGPVGWLLGRAGAIPVGREGSQGMVAALVDRFHRRERLLLAIPPEGTRARRDHWRSGFYHIAIGAGVPVCLSYLDYRQRRGGFGPCWTPSGDLGADMDRVRAFYRDIQGKVPGRFTQPRLREEEVVGVSTAICSPTECPTTRSPRILC